MGFYSTYAFNNETV